MSKLNFLVHLNTYSDASASNNPSLSNFKWTREITGIPASNPISEAFNLAPGESKEIFSGTRTLQEDGTTAYSIALKPLSSSTYRITNTAGTAPQFRVLRANGADATTEVTAVVNGPIVTFSSTGGTAFNLAAVQIGDYVRIGDQFNTLNQGEYKIIAKTTTSFTVENFTGVNEGPITLGAGFASQVRIYGASGVQIGDTLVLANGFSSASFGSYKITDVTDNYVEFYSTDVLPVESGILADLAIYSAAKNLVYLEADQKCTVTINGVQMASMEPFIINNARQPGVFMLKATVWSFSVQNNSLDSASCFVATVE
ncbi:MAG: hypothetical protein HC840_00085 [Leptolyngbyaceae cyanobacterium RM2_2_4]|nr:hypothetical protein [Leptolyngbyaceae cyanobacterium RM2_2_4]